MPAKEKGGVIQPRGRVEWLASRELVELGVSELVPARVREQDRQALARATVGRVERECGAELAFAYENPEARP